MNQVMTDIWPFLLTTLLGVVVAYARYVHNLKERVAVLERAVEDLRQTMERNNETLQKTIEKMQGRLDNHSKKQDDILEKMSSMEKEVLKSMGTVRSDISALSSDLKGLSNLILISDPGVKVNRIQ